MKSLRLFAWGGTLVLFAWFLYFSFSTVTIPHQIEYREGAAQVMTQILMQGGNPFSLEHQPLAMNNYGIGYNLIVFPFAQLFGNTLMIHRTISVFFLLASLLLVARTMFVLKRDVPSSVLCSIFIVVPLAGRGGLGAFPSALGSFLFLSAILIPFLHSFCLPSLAASALLSILAFYTKPYFMICFGIVAAYTFLSISKKKGVFYVVFFLCVFALSFLAVRYSLKLYFIDTFISNLANASRSPDQLWDQLLELGKEFYPGILLAILLLLLRRSESGLRNSPRKDFFPSMDFQHFDSPFLAWPANYFAFTFILCFLSFVLVLGLHRGSYMTSAYQLVMPPFLLWIFQMLTAKSRFFIIALALVLGNILILDGLLLNPSFLLQKDSAAWSQLKAEIRNSRQVLNSPAVVSMLLEAGLAPIDSGQTEYYYNIKPYVVNGIWGPSYDTVNRNGILYRQSIRETLRKHAFDKLILTEGYGSLISLDVINQYYTRTRTITIEMPQTQQTWVIGIWEPRQQ